MCVSDSASSVLDHTIAWTDIDTPSVGSYQRGSLSVSTAGAVAFQAGHLVVRPSVDQGWQTSPGYGTTIAIAPGGQRVASLRYDENGSHVRLFTTARELTIETPHALPMLPDCVTSLQWGDGGRTLLAFAPSTQEVRVFALQGWRPGLWTQSWVEPRFYPPGGILIVPKTRDQILVMATEGSPAKTWAHQLRGVPGTINLTGRTARRRGDRVVVFERRPTVRPTAIYEVVDGPQRTMEYATPRIFANLQIAGGLQYAVTGRACSRERRTALLASKESEQLDDASFSEFFSAYFQTNRNSLHSLGSHLALRPKM